MIFPDMATDPLLVALPGPALGFAPLMRQPGLCHAVFTRCSGYSHPPFDGLNAAVGIGDADAHVQRNRQWIASCLGNGPLLFMRQVHGDRVVCIDCEQPQKLARYLKTAPSADAMVTNAIRVNMVVQTADCQPILFFDPVGRVAAAAHAGWRGGVANIAAKTVAAMACAFGSRPSDLLAAVGPSLGPCCAEFVNYRQELPRKFWNYRQQGVYFDFWAITRDQLLESGLRAEHIHISRICTRCREQSFFSCRRRAVTGRFASVIGLAGG